MLYFYGYINSNKRLFFILLCMLSCTLLEAPTFVLNNIQGPQTWFSGEKVTLYCTASYCMEGTQVIWMVKSAGVTISEIGEDGADVNRDSHQSSGYVAHRERTEESDKEGLQDVTSSLTFTPSISTHQNLSIACKILCDGKVKEKTFQHKYLYGEILLNVVYFLMKD